MNENYVINLGRQLGSGGKEIGEKLAKEFGIAHNKSAAVIYITEYVIYITATFFCQIKTWENISLFKLLQRNSDQPADAP